MAAEEFVLRWNNHQQNFAAVVEDLWRHDTFTDVILCSEGRVFPAHRVILSACSPYFLEILSKVPEHQHPVVFLQGVPLKDLHSLLTFMYSGEVVVSAGCDMASFFRTAENLQIKGLASSLFPFAVAPEPVNTPLSASEGGAGSAENINAGYQVSRPAPGNSGTVSPPITGDMRSHHVSRPTIVSEPMRPSSADVDSPQHQQQAIRIDGRITTSPGRASPPLPLPIRAPVIGPVAAEQHAFSQHHSMLLSSLMGNRYSPTQTSRLIPAALPVGLPSPSAGRPPVVVATPPIGVGPEGPWVPRQQQVVPIAPPIPPGPIASQRMPTYPPPPPLPGPSFSRRGRPPSDVNAPRQESAPNVAAAIAVSEVPAAVAVAEPRPAPPAQNQPLRVTVVTPQGPVTMFQCPYCGKRFRRRDHLRQHIRTHTGEKPFQCNTCGRRFSQSQQVRIHMRVHSDASTTGTANHPPHVPPTPGQGSLTGAGHSRSNRGRDSYLRGSSSSSIGSAPREAFVAESDVQSNVIASQPGIGAGSNGSPRTSSAGSVLATTSPPPLIQTKPTSPPPSSCDQDSPTANNNNA